jgi:predicted transposase YbfD/YdcC
MESVSFLHYFSSIEEPRVPGLVTYPLQEVIFSTLVGVMCRMVDWEEIEFFARHNIEWLRRFLPYHHDIPSAQTFARVFSLFDTVHFGRCFSAWVGSLQEHVRGVIAIDGKTSRGSKHDASGKGALHMVSAFAHEAGLVIGQRRTDDKSNEITAIPQLLEQLFIKGAIVTIDAMGTQKDIAAAIIEKEADYILALKGNQSSLHDDVKLFFQENSRDVKWDRHETVDAGHGRIETRICTVTEDIQWLKQQYPEWKNLRSIIQVESTRFDKKYKTSSTETRYYISSLPADAKDLLLSVRAHWSIENTLHWSLDVTMKDDQNRTRKDNADANLAIIRHAAFNLLKRDKSKLSLAKKQLKAALVDDYRANLLAC